MIEKACREISNHSLDDTFYIVDLGNVLRMYKVMFFRLVLFMGWGMSMCTHYMSMTGSMRQVVVLAR